MYHKYLKKKIHYKNFKNKKVNNEIVKFCVFAGRKKNIEILHKYIITLLKENIIQEYHIFDFTRNLNDKVFLMESYNKLKLLFHNRIFIHNSENKIQNINLQYDWSPFYKTISKQIFYQNSIIIKCDDDILFIDINGLKNAISERKKDKKSFLIHSNCINNNICTYYHQDFFNSIKNNINKYPTGGILGPTFENPIYSYIIQKEFLNNCCKNLRNIYNYYLKDIYINTRISINFILLNGEDCKYFKNTSINDEYELSSYYPEKLIRPNKIIGNFITCHYSYSMQEKILSRKNDLKILYSNFTDKYINNYNSKNNYFYYNNICYNSCIFNTIGKNKFYINNFFYNKYKISTFDNKNLYISYEDDYFQITKEKYSNFDIQFIDKNKIIINLGIYKLNKFNIVNEFKNRNLFLKLLYDTSENIIDLIKNDNFYYMRFNKSQLFINIDENKIVLEKNKKTLWNLEKNVSKEKIYVTRYCKNKKYYYKNLENDNIYTNFYLGWGLENIINVIKK